jgi:zinc transport system substrate-binding protein
MVKLKSKYMRKVLMIVLVFMLFSTGCANSFTSTDKLKIVTSIFPIGDILENLGGDEVEVKVLVSPGASPHNYDPKPSDIAAITEADVVFVVGGEFDNWMK